MQAMRDMVLRKVRFFDTEWVHERERTYHFSVTWLWLLINVSANGITV